MLFSMEKETVSLLMKTLSDMMMDTTETKIKLQALEERLDSGDRKLYLARTATLRRSIPLDAFEQVLAKLRTKLLQG